MHLQPKRPPGRSDQKAAGYALEIIRLRADGYTYSAILAALADIGVHTSETSLRREVRRHLRHVANASVLAQSQPPPLATPYNDSTRLTHLPATPLPKPMATIGRDGAEAFFQAHSHNPLFTSKERA